MAPRCIEPAKGPVDGDFRAVSSKSATHRALVVAALARGTSTIDLPLDADDTRRTREGLVALGVPVRVEGTSWRVDGVDARLPGGARIDLGASGTSARFLAALAALGEKPSVLDGSPRLRERPMVELITALKALGADATSREGGYLPVRAGGRRPRGGEIRLSGGRSSQFASALLMAGSAFERGLALEVVPPLVSFPYVEMTLATLRAFGVAVGRSGRASFTVAPGSIRACRLAIEGDHSAASYLLAAAALTGGVARVRGLARGSAQPDARFLDDLESLGCSVVDEGGSVRVRGPGRIPAFSWDLHDAPDLAPTACALALFAEGPCLLSGLDHLRLKESDRLAALAAAAGRLGARAEVRGGSIAVEPLRRVPPPGTTIEVVGDHRIAMAFAVAGLRCDGIVLDDGDVVAKSYPGFWEDFERLAG